MFYKWLEYIQKQFSLDLRALALLRIGIGCTLIADICIRSGSILAHYTNEGVLPIDAMKSWCWNQYYFSFHAFSGNLSWQLVLFSIAFIAAVCISLGYKTRLFTFISWLLLISLQNRNSLVVQGGDDLLRLILFWGLFLPWNQRYSLDKLKHTLLPQNNSCFHIAGLGYLLLIFSVYFFSALLKDSTEWKTDGTALYYALSLDQLALPFGKLIYPHPQLLKTLTYTVYYTELIAPCLLLVPVFNPFSRSLAIMAIIFLHIGISLTIYVGLFFMIGIVTAIGLIPTPVMDKIEKRLAPVLHFISDFISAPQQNDPESSHVKKIILSVKTNFYFSLVQNSFLAFIIAFSLLWCIGALPGSHYGVSQNFRPLAHVLRLDQNWSMFAPTVLKDDGWYIYEGLTNDSTSIDINRKGKPVDYAKPACVLSYIDNDRWRKFGENYMFLQNTPVRIYFCKYLFKKWNREHPEKKNKNTQHYLHERNNAAQLQNGGAAEGNTLFV